MPTTTTTYSFNKPVVGADEDDWGGYLNGNWDSVDDLLDGTTPVTGIDINSGTLDGVTIGGTTAGAGTFTTLTANTSITGTLATAAQPNITSVGSLTSLDVGGTVTADGLTVDGNATINDNFPYILLNESDTTDLNTRISVGSGYFNLNTLDDAYTVSKQRFRLDNSTGDISFYEDTGTTPKFFWDASAEKLGLNTTSPAALLDLKHNSASTHLRLTENTSGNWSAFGVDTSDNLRVYVNNTERMRIDSSGNVGIGDTSPYTWSSVQPSLNLRGTSASFPNRSGALIFKSQSGTHMTVMDFETGNDLRWYQSSNSGSSWSERMRIDSSGNLLVGTTDSNVSDNSGASNGGINIGTAGIKGVISAAAGQSVAYLNRLGSDGDIAVFRKDGSTVGSIGTQGGDLWVGTGNTGAYFWDGSNTIAPWNTSTNTTRDASIDLGTSSVRWRDLYLSGGVYLGGTGASNHLDDYEEGTYTPVVDAGSASGTRSYAYQQGVYTKIGRRVFVWFDLNVSSWSGASGTFLLSLPFSSSSTSEMGQFTPWDIHNNYTGGGTPTQWIPQNSSYMYMYTWTLHSATGHNGWNLNTTGRISGSVSYTVD